MYVGFISISVDNRIGGDNNIKFYASHDIYNIYLKLIKKNLKSGIV